MPPGQQGPLHAFDGEQVRTITSGGARLELGDDELVLRPGDAAVLPADVLRRVTADSAEGLQALVPLRRASARGCPTARTAASRRGSPEPPIRGPTPDSPTATPARGSALPDSFDRVRVFDHLDRWADPDMMTDEEREQRRQALAQAHPVHRWAPRVFGILFAGLVWLVLDGPHPIVAVVALVLGFGLYLQGEWLVRRRIGDPARPGD